MKTVKIVSGVVENFQSWKHREFLLSDKIMLYGENGAGKSTFKKIIDWVLLGTETKNDKIRPHDEDGNDIDGADIEVRVTFLVDEREIELYRKQHLTKSGTKTNSYAINGIPKNTEKEYRAWIDENIMPTDLMISCMDIDSFFANSMEKRRNILLSKISGVTDDEVIASESKLEEIKPMLSDGTLAQIKKRSKDRISAYDQEMKRIDGNIEAYEKLKVDIDVAELELSRKAIIDEISDVEKKLLDCSSIIEDHKKLGAEIMELQFSINDLKREAMDELESHKRELNRKISELNNKLLITTNCIQSNNHQISQHEMTINELFKEKDSLTEQWKSVKAERFDKNTCVCPTCHQALPKGETDKHKTEFETSKENRLSRIVDRGNAVMAKIREINSIISYLKDELEENLANHKNFELEISDLQAKLSNLPALADVTGLEEYKNLTLQMQEKEDLLKVSSIDNDELIAKNSELRSKLSELDAELAKANRNIELDEKIMQSKERKKEIPQMIANEEKIKDLVDLFISKQAKLLQNRVNTHFGIVKWKLFETLQNGEMKETCRCLVGGSDFESNLNLGHRLLATIDILVAFQNANEVKLPVFIDNLESIDPWRIPKMDNQVVFMKHTDDKGLNFKEV